jgi:hypothetical protein
MIAGQVPETIMTGNTNDISHIAEFGWYDWVMFRDNKPSYPDNKLVLGSYLGPTIDTGLALNAKILNSLTAKSFPKGTKNSCPEGFLRAKHTAHKHPYLDEPFFTPVAWF